MKRIVWFVAVLAALMIATTSTAFAKGNGLTLEKVMDQGWGCAPPGVMWHCVHPNTDFDALLAGELPSVPSLNFDADGNFLGTEVLIRADLGSDDRPCPQGTEADGTYEPVDFGGSPGPEYFSCHHNN